MQNEQNLIWIDLEMTGLNEHRDHIIEIATIITDAQLNVLAEGPVIAIYQSDEILNLMDDWCVKTHGNSGLTQRVKESKISLEQAEQATLAFITTWVAKGFSPMCGNSIGNDRRFLAKYMPQLHDYFHYRNIDVSTLKELVARWAPNDAKYPKAGSHLALNDIRESIGELQFYREKYFRI